MSKLPSFLIKNIPKRINQSKIRNLISDESIHTVCESAKCPNLGECFSRNTLTFMILGDICTRTCAFCGVKKGTLFPPDPDEPEKIAEAVKKLGLNYVVVTSVTRDDLPDYGASQFVRVIEELKPLPVEVLIPDLCGEWEELKKIVDAGPYVLNHNIETVPRLYKQIRPQAIYKRSLKLLKRAKELNSRLYVKSGFMVGLGETDGEVFDLLQELKSVSCDIVTIGQYLPPSRNHAKPERFVDPSVFEEYKTEGEKLGLKVFSGPFVRSSYQASKIISLR
ncbi:lipoyl synthase [candidate division WOR-1 bacterium RIFOXYA2_FULL_36_21]|uniref:Lipoyl synthase n=1 Tax=candidate division WOR-1 bacterium RIFOXYB2_FULL_36_35 TaxID=1802578 RepID=A0A1F4RYX0_UNCSA|nr:MAG: lipoyl synthase [candidate division WOR-1 bacterium RIFOXYA2_FULL_36_21]OGC13370.1 MAG: lipoyl synthase [candidate division WOR-1 bacterium RIFOXYB2_FULL_36_35]OGC15420.1 MAG: lipoyl synthase [candidate division WOR-1 bacterium RIFOXYA12_FULL_36_13]